MSTSSDIYHGIEKTCPLLNHLMLCRDILISEKFMPFGRLKYKLDGVFVLLSIGIMIC